MQGRLSSQVIREELTAGRAEGLFIGDVAFDSAGWLNTKATMNRNTALWKMKRDEVQG